MNTDYKNNQILLQAPVELPICTICFEPVEEKQESITTKCKHQFHKACLEPWITGHRKQPKCPNCMGLQKNEWTVHHFGPAPIQIARSKSPQAEPRSFAQRALALRAAIDEVFGRHNIPLTPQRAVSPVNNTPINQ